MSNTQPLKSSRARWIAASAASALTLAALAGGCAAPAKPVAHTLTDRERDSIIATEKALPGSAVVGRALATTDAEAARAKAMEKQADGDAPESGNSSDH